MSAESHVHARPITAGARCLGMRHSPHGRLPLTRARAQGQAERARVVLKEGSVQRLALVLLDDVPNQVVRKLNEILLCAWLC